MNLLPGDIRIDVSLAGYDGRTPLAIAVENRSTEIAELIRAHSHAKGSSDATGSE